MEDEDQSVGGFESRIPKTRKVTGRNGTKRDNNTTHREARTISRAAAPLLILSLETGTKCLIGKAGKKKCGGIDFVRAFSFFCSVLTLSERRYVDADESDMQLLFDCHSIADKLGCATFFFHRPFNVEENDITFYRLHCILRHLRTEIDGRGDFERERANKQRAKKGCYYHCHICHGPGQVAAKRAAAESPPYSDSFAPSPPATYDAAQGFQGFPGTVVMADVTLNLST
ncbi:hypothetical protein MRX96_055051 [Rhipicephalus microplus]